MVGMCLAAASWQSKNGLLVTLPPSQPVAGLCPHHLKLLQAVAQLWCLIVEMRLAAASWQSKNCLLRYSRSKLRILIKMCCVVAVLCWCGPFRSRPRSIPVPDLDHPCTTPKGSAVHSVFRAGLLGFIKSCVARNHHVFEMCKMFKINGEMHNFKAKIDI